MVRLFFPGLLLVAAGCASGAANLRTEGAVSRAEVRLVKAVDVRKEGAVIVASEPVEASDIFYASDWQVIAWVSLGELDKAHQVRWIWYDPSGERYLDSGDAKANPEGGRKRFNQLWHALRIWGEPAARRAGRWNVTFYLDGEPAASRDFTLRVR
jgi:hypothetical protein